MSVRTDVWVPPGCGASSTARPTAIPMKNASAATRTDPAITAIRRFRKNDLDEFVGTSRGRERPVVLIVDDDAGLRASLRASLESDGVEVREAASAEEGLAALEDEPPSLILLDVMMPQVDGWEMLRMVRERHGLEAMPVVMFSGAANGADEAEERGAQAFVGKPFDPEKLLASTRQLLRR